MPWLDPTTEPLSSKERLALKALDSAPDACLRATNKPQNEANLNATIARHLHERGYIQKAPGWLRDVASGNAVAWTFTEAGVDALQAL